MSRFFVANVDALDAAIRSTGESVAAIARAGKLSRDTLKNARNGKRVSEAKASGIIKGLKQLDVDPVPEFEDIFVDYEE